MSLNKLKSYNYSAIYIFIIFLTIYTLVSSGKITTSMDVDVLRYSKNFIENLELGSKVKLSSGVAYSAYTKKFYPQEGVGVILVHSITAYISKILTPKSDLFLYLTGALLMALTVMVFFRICRIFLPLKESILSTIIFGLATPVFVHSKYFFPEPLLMLFIALCLYNYFLIFYTKKGDVLNYLFLGLTLGATLFCRPDSPIFVGFFFLLFVFKIKNMLKDKNILKYFAISLCSFGVILALFFISNNLRYGRYLETGYTLKRSVVIASLKDDLNTLKPKLQKIKSEASLAYQQNSESENTKNLIIIYQKIAQEIQGKELFLNNLQKQQNEIGDKNTSFTTNGIANYFYGVYLILFNPSRSIFFLSPILLFLFLGGVKLIKNKKIRIDLIFCSLIFLSYLSLYALRAPLSYSGSAAWGVRYMLPLYLLLMLGIIPLFKDKNSIFYNNKFKKVFYIFVIISSIIQFIGSTVSYQTVQMPLEYACKQKFGSDDMTWARESRKELMTTFRGGLLYNNLYIVFDKLPPVLSSFLDSRTLQQIESSNQLKLGINDWYFLNLLNSKKDKDNLILFLLLFLFSGFSIYSLTKKLKEE